MVIDRYTFPVSVYTNSGALFKWFVEKFINCLQFAVREEAERAVCALNGDVQEGGSSSELGRTGAEGAEGLVSDRK